MPDYHEFPDNSELLFGRKADLAYLLERVQHQGITAIYGQPQMGKPLRGFTTPLSMPTKRTTSTAPRR